MPKKLISSAKKSLPAKTSETKTKLLEELGKNIPSADVTQFDDNLFLEMVETHWQLAKSRTEGEPKLAVYCPIAENGKTRKTVIDVVSDDLAFLVDSIVAEINRHSLLIDFLIHPFFYAQYNKKNELTDISTKPKKGYIRQSHVHIHIKDTFGEDILEKLEHGLYTSLNDVYTANRDWRKMLHRLEDARNALAKANTRRDPKEINRYCAFLDYLHNNNFTLLGYREYEFTETKSGLKSKIVKGRSLGLLDDETRPAYINDKEEGLPRNLQELRRNLSPVSISKTNRLASVHRRVPMDAIAVKSYDVEGNVVGEKLFLGLFTSVTYSRSVADVPYLRDKVEAVMNMSDFLPNTHDRKGLRHILEKYPRDELFQIDEKELLDICLNILRLQERQRVALFVRRDPFRRYISCLVYIPRDRFGSGLRRSIGKILETELNGTISNFYTSLDDSVFARVMYMINVDQKNPPKYNLKAIEALLQEEAQTWQERLNDALSKKLEDEEEIVAMTLKYGEAFPIDYTSRYKAIHSVFDIYKIETALETNTLQLELYVQEDGNGGQLRLKVYSPGAPIVLSDVMPILAHMGVRAISELPFEITPRDSEDTVWIHDFHLEIEGHNGDVPDIKKIKEKFETAFTKIWYNEMDSDALNALVLTAAMDWEEVIVLRTYVRYLKQIKYPFGRLFVERTLTQHARIAGLLVGLFNVLLDPNNKDGDALAYEAAIETELENVFSLDQDRIIRSVKALINATLRTNFFQPNADGGWKSYTSIKLDCTKISDLPEPKPLRETFVYSRRMEGVHLRGDMIARGGLRWSDRHEDYRTEVLGLMKAQMVKNSVIVPMGAKGGFVIKTPTKDREDFQREGIECYKIFIRGLLDVADNRKGNRIIPPKDVVRRDGDDPYLVVAADKGTATFSDIANALSQEYGFWLDDAFASGGSAGYDHKKMGITARGAWESVKLHFRQLNHNTQEQAFEVIGIGDMGGDVFGNGMLLSKHIRLVGAFNHLHIFCDPDPDPTVGFKERQRLFKGVKGWDAYDTSKLSKGGMIYDRSEKLLKLTPEIRERFDIDREKVSPLELINKMLKARTDLLWFGGIGTYIKGTDENDSEVGDKANDPIRVNATDVRAKVIGEGANLAITQHGRIEFSGLGGLINTDFVDNSAGVDSSDHEVNIKILLSDVMRKPSNKMDIKARNTLLESMTEEVADHVLRNNYQQAQAVSLAEMRAGEDLKTHEEFIQELERNHGLSREGEALPDQEEIERRLRIGKGLTRPELCVLVSYAKIRFTQDLLVSDIPDRPAMKGWLDGYFPEALQKTYLKDIRKHRLSREIIAMRMANSLVNRMGPTFVKEMMKKTGASSADVAEAYLVVREVFAFRTLWDEIEALDNQVPADVQLRAMQSISALAEHAVSWMLTRMGRRVDMAKDIQNYGKNIALLRKDMNKVVSKSIKNIIQGRIDEQVRNGIPKKLAEQIAILPTLFSACDIIRIALENKANVIKTAEAYFELGDVFHFDWLRQQARYLNPDDPWEDKARAGLIDQLYGTQAGLTIHIFSNVDGKTFGRQFVRSWIDEHQDILQQHDAFFRKIRNSGSVEISMLVLAVQRLRNIYGG